VAAAVAAAVLFGLAPAIRATSTAAIQPGRRPRYRTVLVVGQVATCVVLLVTAGLLLGGAGRIRKLDALLSTHNTIQLDVQEKFREPVLGRLASEPLIYQLAAARSAPVERKDTAAIQADDGMSLNIASNAVSPDYFSVFEIPILRGRNFTAEEARSGAAAAVISQTAARRLWPNREAVGRSLRISARGTGPSHTVTVIGIARDEISRWLANGEDTSLVYLPTTAHAVGIQLFAGVRGPVETARWTMDAHLTALDPNALKQIQKLQIRDWVAEDAYYTYRVAYWVSGAIGLLALLLTLSGIYGVLSYVISQRTKEIGIRIAMGATSGAVTRLILRQSMRLAVAGAAIGGMLALALSRVLAAFLVTIDSFAIGAYATGVALVLAACAAAAYFPSRRAARIDPLRTLRYD
jgi:hypothetical protein